MCLFVHMQMAMMMQGMGPPDEDSDATPPLSVIRHLILKLETVMSEAAATGNKAAVVVKAV